MTRSSTDPLYVFDPEIELTLRRLRKIRNAAVNTSSSIDSVIDSDQFCTDNSVASSNIFTKPRQMENHDRTLKELATLDAVYQPWSIQYPQLEPAQTYELKSGLIHLLPKFHGLAGEDPHKHLKEFHVAVGNPRRLHQDEGVPILPGWSHKGLAISAASTLQHLGDMKRTFLEKFFPTSRIHFNKLYAICPHHQINEQLLIQYFYEGLSMMDRSMIDAASGGALMDKTPAAVRHLISNMASNTQKFRIRGSNPSRSVNEIGAASNQRLENQLDVPIETTGC
ncbi:hypothetical protein CR513_55571, partial [Mucuna pruriens]